MENAVNISVSPIQMLLSLAFQIWIIVFPIIIIKKLNYLTQLLEENSDADQETL